MPERSALPGRVLVFGLSGQVGEALLPRLLAGGSEIWAVSREPRATPGVNWLQGSLASDLPLPRDLDAVISVGPLDAFAEWHERKAPSIPRIVALGSTGRIDKRDSLDADERALALRLQRAEDQLFASAQRAGTAATLLRPTLIYGAGRDHTLARLIATAQRFRWLPLPSDAIGLRQPVHVDDIADAIVRCLPVVATHGRGYDLPGAESLTFLAMARRACASQAPEARVIALPAALFALALGVHAYFRKPAAGLGLLSRLRADQLADAGPARRDFGYAPGAFRP